ncbi:ubiquinol oxidase subunit II [Paracoccus shanxieyensis]|uniref:Ubiquinol oxidase polypeptide II n=1 Tax=Paracoccus shanxieyensis TaxID=2675752 RepID=A0A6L6J000_9RHOB|nr:ubiquinol oxidase subunit II [Paracoccus shanxieyensis]MTH65499.1 ubiquinol oxidase subunit II [Paracoccus shanxieyensis]MTH88705.1 ubiquinol oxidase subunit II [Paracoccus shanxieyensis]
MRKLPRLARFVALAPLFLALAACKMEVLKPSGDVAERQKDLLLTSTWLMLIIIIPVMLLTVLFAWRYRASNKNATYKPDWDHSTKFELVIWAAPLLIVICLGAMTWVGTHLLDPYRPLDRIAEGQPVPDQDPLRVEVVALDWKWLFIYPEQGIAMVNEMAVPVDREVEFSLTSTSVMNAFYIPAMAGMIYAMPGMETKLHGVFNNPGEYQGLASHYSGAGFSGMRFKAHAVDQAGFDAWVDEARASGANLDRAKFLELETPSENVKPTPFGEVDPSLFDRIVNMCVEDGKICMAEMMALDAQGGTGLAGTMNMAQLTHDKDVRRGVARPVFGSQPFMVTGFCTPADSAKMFADLRENAPVIRKDQSPMRGIALPRPENRLGIEMPRIIQDARRDDAAEPKL